MQHRYVGDIGDYLKLSLLRAVQPDHRLGIAWWLHPGEVGTTDGRHIGYLLQPGSWRRYDPEVFDHISGVVAELRHLSGLESAPFLSDCAFASEEIPRGVRDRREWVRLVLDRFESCDVVFFDPDNGLEPLTFQPGTRQAGKSISLEEIRLFKREGRTLIVYHHQTRFKGGHVAEIGHWASRLSDDFDRVDVLRCKPWSPRAYFLLDASDEIRSRVQALSETWGDQMVWNPHIGG